MSTEPPRAPWTDLLDQVRDALEDAGIGAGEVRDEVVQGVGEALRALREAGLAPEAPDASTPEPTVGVVEGGRAAGAPPTPGPRPDLHVAEPQGGEPLQQGPEAPRVQVTVRTAPVRQPLEGTVDFALDSDAAQTLYRGAEPHPYRIAIDTGAVRLLLDGAPAEALSAGQSMDVDVCHLRVLAEEDGARGRFLRLPR